MDLEKRAAELFLGDHARSGAVRLAREALDAAAKECDEAKTSIPGDPMDDWWRGRHLGFSLAASIIRRIANAKPGANERPDSFARKGNAVPETPPAPLSDAEILEHAAAHLERRFGTSAAYPRNLLHEEAAKLRAAQEPADVFVLAASTIFLGRPEIPNAEVMSAADFLRERFSPLVSALEGITDPRIDGLGAVWRQAVAASALAAFTAALDEAEGKA